MGHRYNLLLSRSIQNVYIVQCNFLHTFALFVACQELVHHLFSRFLSVPTFLYIPFCLTCSALPFISPDIGYPLFLDVVCTIKLTFSCIILQPHTQLGVVQFLSHGILNSAPGWSLKAKDPTPPQQLIKDVAL